MSATVWSAAKEPPTGGKRESCYLIAVWVRMTLAGCGGVCRWTVARIAAVCVCAAVGPRGAFLHRSHNLQCPAHACTATLARQPEHRKTTAGITSPRCWIKSSLYPQKSRINTKNVNVCAEREGEREREREKRHLKIYIYSEPVRDQTAKLICSSFNPCSAPSPQFPLSPSIDFPHGPSP